MSCWCQPRLRRKSEQTNQLRRPGLKPKLEAGHFGDYPKDQSFPPVRFDQASACASVMI
jgi:hypothetical protein